jgi:hypothetical protein
MEFISERKTETKVEYSLFYKTDPSGAGYSFPCDENGQVFVDQLKPTALASYQRCQTGKVLSRSIQANRWSYTTPAVIRCVCGAEVELHGFTNTCDECERDYNMSGQLLADRSQWGEETGESLSDILMSGSSDYDID